MATLSALPTARELPALLTAPRSRGRRDIRTWTIAAAVLAVAVAIRIWNLGAIMATSDQVAIAWAVQHNYGIKWFFAHDYGPVLPILQRTWAELLSRLHLPIDEAALRIPIAAASVLQILFTFGLVRRLGGGRSEAILAAAVCSVIPTLVSDAHYAWGYNTVWLLTGTVSLWAILTYLDEDRPYWLFLGGTALLLHCLSNCFAFALPVALMYVWWDRRRTRQHASSSPATPRHRAASLPLGRSFGFGFIIPCVLALAVIYMSWRWTGGGQLGRLLHKHDAGSTGWRFTQFLDLPSMWVSHFGYLFALSAAAGLIWATLTPRYRVLAVWSWAAVLPLTLLVDWTRVGYPGAYMIEAAYAAGVLAAIWICAMLQRLSPRPVARLAFACAAALALCHMGVGSADACLNEAQFVRWTGLKTFWGSVRPETGIKAAGYYVRAHVPPEAVVMTIHTNTGMEVSVAEYYCGRAVLADYDLRPEMLAPLVREMHAEVDVLIADAAYRDRIDTLPDFELAATIRHDDEPVRYIYARPGLNLPHVDEQAATFNALYDRHCRNTRVPTPLPAPPQFDERLARYQGFLKSLRAAERPTP